MKMMNYYYSNATGFTHGRRTSCVAASSAEVYGYCSDDDDDDDYEYFREHEIEGEAIEEEEDE